MECTSDPGIQVLRAVGDVLLVAPGKLVNYSADGLAEVAAFERVVGSRGGEAQDGERDGARLAVFGSTCSGAAAVSRRALGWRQRELAPTRGVRVAMRRRR